MSFVKFAFVFLLLSLITLNAQTLDGKTIMQKALNKSTWKYMQGDVELILINSQGQKRIRKIKMFSRKRNENESDMLMRFVAPPDVKNIAFLTIEHSEGDDERYLYLPALRRVKRITSSGKGGNFMSSDFTYYDIGKPKLNDWTYKRLEDEKIDGFDCYKLECLPANEQIAKDTGYRKIIRWIRKDVYVTVRSQYFDKGLKEWKILEVPKIENIGGVLFQTDMIMKDVQTGHSSEMIFNNIMVNKKLPDNFFSKRFLTRLR